MASVAASKRAEAELVRILDFLSVQAGTKTAADYERRFEAAFDRLVNHPQSGAPRPSFGRDVRILVVDPYLVFYRYRRRSDAVVILRVLHGHRRIASRPS